MFVDLLGIFKIYLTASVVPIAKIAFGAKLTAKITIFNPDFRVEVPPPGK
jgi:hypothetical protein